MVVLGGLVTSTLVSLVAVPAMCVVCGAAEVEPDLELIDDVSDAVARPEGGCTVMKFGSPLLIVGMLAALPLSACKHAPETA